MRLLEKIYNPSVFAFSESTSLYTGEANSVYTQKHSSVILSQVDENTLRKLGINLTCEPRYQTKRLFHG